MIPETLPAHILYMDIVGSSLRSMTEQREVYENLNALVSTTQTYQEAKRKNSVLSRPSGDGMALVFMDDMEAPIQCAIELAAKLKSYPSLAVRMGIHSGSIYRVTDINGLEDVTGDGIISARRVMDCGDSGHILVSASVAEVLENRPSWAGRIKYIGVCLVKHGKRVALWNVTAPGVGNPALPKVLVEQVAEQIKEKEKPPPGLISIAAVVLGVYVIGSAILTWGMLWFNAMNNPLFNFFQVLVLAGAVTCGFLVRRFWNKG